MRLRALPLVAVIGAVSVFVQMVPIPFAKSRVVIALFAVIVSVLLTVRLRTYARGRAAVLGDKCTECGYCLRYNVSKRCPECGNAALRH